MPVRRLEIKTEAAQQLEALVPYAGDVCCVDSGSDAADPVFVHGAEGWASTPFQNAGFDLDTLAAWLWNQGGCCTYLADISSDGSATVVEVEFADEDDEDEGVILGQPADTTVVQYLPACFWLDQDMVELVRGKGDAISGGDVGESAAAWLDADFSATDAEPWMDAGVFDADAARRLDDAGLTPAQVAGDRDAIGTLGYRYANGDTSLDDVRRAAGLLEEVAP